MTTCAYSRCKKRLTAKQLRYKAACCSTPCARRHREELDPEKYRKKRLDSHLKAAAKRSPEERAARVKKFADRIKVVRQWLADYKMKRGCVDCGYKKHPAALQLDHEGKKRVSIARARTTIARLKSEIRRGKCKVRCGNCHAIKTWERKQAKKESKV